MFKIPVFFKLLLSLLAVYIGIAYSLFLVSKPTYNYRQENLLNQQATILMRPVMEVLANGKVSHWYNWQNISKGGINQNVTALKISSGDKKLYRDLGNSFAFENTLASLGGIKEAAIIEPLNYKESWSLVFCDTKYDTCQESNILTKGRAKILVDGTQNVWGKTTSGKHIELKLVEYINRSAETSVLFI